MDGKDFDGKRLIVEWTKRKPRSGRSPRGYDSRRRSRPATGRNPPERSDYRLAVYNLPDRCHWSELKDHFRQIGNVVFSDVIGTRGVIEYKYKEDMENAIKELNGVKWRGYSLQVEKDLRSRDSHRRRSRRSRSRSDDSRSPSYSSRSRSRSGDRKKPNRERSQSPDKSPDRSLSPKNGDKKRKYTPSPTPDKEKPLTP